MQKLYNILVSLDIYALNRLRKWLCSPIHNEQEALIALFDACRAVLKKDKKGSIIDWQTAKMVFPKQDANKYSDLIKRVEAWFAYEWQCRNEVQLILGTAAFYNEKGFEQYANEELVFGQTLHNNATQRNAAWHYTEYCLAEARENKNVKNVRQTGKTELQYICNQLDTFFIAKRLAHYIDALTYKNVLKLDIDTAGLPELIAFIEVLNLQNTPLISIYYHSIMTLYNDNNNDNDNTEHFAQLVASLNTHHQLLAPFEAREYYTVALNYCVRRINMGETAYFIKLFNLYKLLLQNEIIFDNGILPEWDYKNVITIGLRLGEFDWVERFLQEYSQKLPHHLRENALTYNLAKLYFAQADYQKVIEQLRDVQYIDVVYSLDSRATLLKTYYELRAYEALESNLESFRIYLLRNKTIATNVKKQYENLIRFTKKIMLLSKNDQKAKQQLIAKIEATEQIGDKKWLLEKLR